MDLRLVRRSVDGHRRLEPFEIGRDRLGAKQLAGIVKDEGRGDGKLAEPPRRPFVPVPSSRTTVWQRGRFAAQLI